MEGIAEKAEDDLENQKAGFEEKVENLEAEIQGMKDSFDAVEDIMSRWRLVKLRVWTVREFDTWMMDQPFAEVDDSKLYKLPGTVTPPTPSSHAKAA